MTKANDSFSYASFFFQGIKSLEWWILCPILLSVLWAADLSLRPYLIKMMINHISSDRGLIEFNFLWHLAFFYAGLSLLIEITYRANDWIWLHLEPKLREHLTVILVKRLMDHSQHFYQGQFSGSLVTKINDVSTNIPHLLRIFIEAFLNRTMALAIATYAMWIVNPHFSIALIVWVILFLAIAFKSLKKFQTLSHERAHLRAQVTGRMVDMFSNMLSIKIFVGKWIEIEELRKIFQKFIAAMQKRDWFFIKIFSLQGLSFIIFQIFCLWWLIEGLKNQSLSPGDFALILGLNVSILEALWHISNEMREFSERLGEITQGMDIIFVPIEITDRKDAKELIIEKGEIVFEKVEFYYKNTQPLFSDLSTIIYPGQKIGLVGYSGSGKTTFANLIIRLFEVTSGAIFIDNQNIQDVTQDSLRHNIAMIPQDTPLFHRTLLENIRYGRMEATDVEVIEAAKRAHAHEFICALPNGYNALVGERGVKLSGGQRQRIAIARAALKNSLILILDEATSHLDSVTESLIQESLWDLMENKTTIVIAHRLATLLHMDRILVFDKGQIIQDGTHEILVKSEGLYNILWSTQSGGFLPQKRLA